MIDEGHSSAMNHTIDRFQAELVRGLRDAGVKLLAGRDSYMFGHVAGFDVRRRRRRLISSPED